MVEPKKREQPKLLLPRARPQSNDRQYTTEGFRTPAGRANQLPHHSDIASQSGLRETSGGDFSPTEPEAGREDRRPTNGGRALPRVSLFSSVGRPELAPKSPLGKCTRCAKPCVHKRRQGSRLLGLVARFSLRSREVPGSLPGAPPRQREPSQDALKVEARGGPLAAWSSGVILASGARGRGLTSRSSPAATPRGQHFSALPPDGATLRRDPGSNRGQQILSLTLYQQLSRLLRRARRLDGPGPRQASNAPLPRGERLTRLRHAKRLSFALRFARAPKRSNAKAGRDKRGFPHALDHRTFDPTAFHPLDQGPRSVPLWGCLDKKSGLGGPKTPGTSATPSAPPGPKKLTRSIKGQELRATTTEDNGPGRARPRTTPQPLPPPLCGTVVAKRADWEAPKHLGHQRRLRSPRAEEIAKSGVRGNSD
jgi:hypothetical protein